MPRRPSRADRRDHQCGLSLRAQELTRLPGPDGRKVEVILNSTITCPACGMRRTETMPTDACLFFYECTGCAELLRPKPGDCCVFCSYGSVPCPPIQASE